MGAGPGTRRHHGWANRSDAAEGPSRNAIYNASAIPLDAAGYVEEEFFVESTANRYATSDLETGSVVDGGHPYRSRFIVRRPPPEHFNGVVMVEWFNLTGRPDKDIDWWLSGHHFVREGYAFIAVSAQQVGIETLKELSPQRYGTLDVSDSMVKRGGLSYDVFSVVAKAVLRPGEQPAPGAIDILRGLRAETLIATGHSQSASRLATYFNNVHPLDPIFDGGMVHGVGGRLRDDQDVRSLKRRRKPTGDGGSPRPSRTPATSANGRSPAAPTPTTTSRSSTRGCPPCRE